MLLKYYWYLKKTRFKLPKMVSCDQNSNRPNPSGGKTQGRKYLGKLVVFRITTPDQIHPQTL